MDFSQKDRFALPDFGKFSDPHLLPLFNNMGPNARAPAPKQQASHGPRTHTLDPNVTGTSVLGIKFKGGVMLAADTLASYGSLARFREVQRIESVGKYTILGATGEFSDFQYIMRTLDQLTINDEIQDDGHAFHPNSIHSYLTRIFYERRNKMDPIWNQLVVAGFREGQSFLGLVDLYGTNYEDDTIATGYGNHIARPLMRKAYRPDLTRDEAKQVLEMCLRILYYRDARALNRIQIATITAEGSWISEPYQLSEDWSVGTIKYDSSVKQTEYVFDSNNPKIH